VRYGNAWAIPFLIAGSYYAEYVHEQPGMIYLSAWEALEAYNLANTGRVTGNAKTRRVNSIEEHEGEE